ncbi:TetR/AcrR family transcriptional regulator [Microscilla marina]|uniref:Transcriptional regulator, TetR family protein n=1 Tax=Microscilla marina ATCC 23134 TaxID=313606 RepID=A1ZCN3_MICM2|nr:TetR/AcrR family transcriptional regulator [Microscilla marina]EAY32035.1 transcriptional regulator, TetR family protein [Microscilla marina ATCC 23134]
MKLKDQEKQARIRQVTIDIVSEQGIAGVKMASVAKRAEVVPSTLYTYYKNKETLIVSTFTYIAQQMTEELHLLFEPVQPFRKLLWNLFEQAIDYKLKHHKEDIFFKMFIVSPYFDKATPETKRALETAARQLMEFGKEQMIIKAETPDMVLIAALDGIIDKLVDYHYKNMLTLDEAIIQAGFDVLWDAVT